jgi:uncharacterized protein
MKPKNKKEKPIRAIYFKSIIGATSFKALEGDNKDSDDCFGYLAGYGNKDDGEDILIQGCAAKSITERGPGTTTARKIAMLAYHDQRIPAGRFTTLREEEKGLYYEGTLDRVPYVQHTLKPQLKSQTINQHSIGYNYVWDKTEYDTEKEAFICKEIDLFEGSFVTLGMNENTPFGGFKAWYEKQDQVKQMHLDAEKVLKRLKSSPAEFELRIIMQKYQSLLDNAADEIKIITAKKKKPVHSVDYKYLVDNFKL